MGGGVLRPRGRAVTRITQSDWHLRATKGEAQAIRADLPQPGYYATKGAKGGALVPARIWQEHGRLYCTVAGEDRSALQEWPYLARRPISGPTYDMMMKTLKDQFETPKAARKARLHELKPRW